MSDMGTYGPFTDQTDSDLIAMYAGMDPALFGSDPAKRLNYYQDLMSSLGFDIAQLSGVTNPDPVQQTYTPPINQTGAMYSSNPFYASIFQAIEDGADPISAAKAARDQLGFTGTDDDFNNQVVTIATNYAADKAKNQQAQMDWQVQQQEAQAKAGGGWTMPDGSKYKQSPLGGNDINATASEYELLGAPSVDALLAEYGTKFAAPDRAAATDAALKRGYGVSSTAGLHDGSDGTGWSLGGSGTPRTPVTPAAAGGVPGPYDPNGWHPGVQYDSLRDPATRAEMDSGRGPNLAQQVAGILAGARTPAAATAPATMPLGPKGKDLGFFKNLENTQRNSVQRRLDKAKSNQVRSDANINAMRRITALAGLLQGRFPK